MIEFGDGPRAPVSGRGTAFGSRWRGVDWMDGRRPSE